MSGNELPKILDKTQADIEATIAAIKSFNLPGATREFTISCDRLAVWLPKALLEQKIKLANLRNLIFGTGRKNKIKKNDAEQSTSTDENTTENDRGTSDKEETSAVVPADSETPITKNHIAKPGHGRLPHTAYINTIEHQLEIAEYKSGDLYPMLCNGKLYYIDLGVIVRVKGQNLAAVH